MHHRQNDSQAIKHDFNLLINSCTVYFCNIQCHFKWLWEKGNPIKQMVSHDRLNIVQINTPAVSHRLESLCSLAKLTWATQIWNMNSPDWILVAQIEWLGFLSCCMNLYQENISAYLKLPSLFAAWLFWTFHAKSHNMKALIILSHSWSPFLPLTCSYSKNVWSIFLRKNSPQITH